MAKPPEMQGLAGGVRYEPDASLVVQGDMTVAEVPMLLRQLNPAVCVRCIDLSAVRRVDSSALSLILACSRTARGEMLSVHHAPPALRALADLYGLQTLFRMV